jgi:CheY-like chemotaxis protein
MRRGTLDLTRIAPDMGAQLLAQLVRFADRLGFALGAAPYRDAQDPDRREGRSKLTNVALAASSVRLYHREMEDQFPDNESVDDQIMKRDARVIAVVDDDQGFRDALHLFLRTFAFQVDAFASGQEFLRSSRLDAVGCVILDLAMPEMDGLEVQRQLASRGLQMPIVFVTAHRDDYLGQRASAAGALAVLRKPVDHEQLVRLVREALGGQ